MKVVDRAGISGQPDLNGLAQPDPKYERAGPLPTRNNSGWDFSTQPELGAIWASPRAHQPACNTNCTLILYLPQVSLLKFCTHIKP